jgi:hypothetical protein
VVSTIANERTKVTIVNRKRNREKSVTVITKRLYVLEYKGMKQKIHGWRIMTRQE